MSETEVPSVLSGPEEAEALLAASRRELDEVDAALSRLADGSYGSCQVCGQVIGDDVLERQPTARHCPAHAVGH